MGKSLKSSDALKMPTATKISPTGAAIVKRHYQQAHAPAVTETPLPRKTSTVLKEFTLPDGRKINRLTKIVL